NTFPQPQVVNPQYPTGGVPGVTQPQGFPQQVPQALPQQGPMNYPTAPNGGVAVPGMVVTPPQQPGQQPGVVVPQPGIPQPAARRNRRLTLSRISARVARR